MVPTAFNAPVLYGEFNNCTFQTSSVVYGSKQHSFHVWDNFLHLTKSENCVYHIWGFHDSDYEEYVLLWQHKQCYWCLWWTYYLCQTLSSKCNQLCLLPASYWLILWTWRRKLHQKQQLASTLHSITSLKNETDLSHKGRNMQKAVCAPYLSELQLMTKQTASMVWKSDNPKSRLYAQDLKV